MALPHDDDGSVSGSSGRSAGNVASVGGSAGAGTAAASEASYPNGHFQEMGDGNRDFNAALKTLSGLITQRKRADGSNRGDAFALMFDYVKVLELEKPLSDLSIIHVAGTKGKGSTCAFVESILREGGHSTGLFTSPHLVDVRERIRIGGQLVSERVFLEHFWWCIDRLREATRRDGLPPPPYFRFLTLLALRIFTQLKVDVAILEVGIGGRYDATNVVSSPAVCGVSSLGFDHMALLGDTLFLIAGEKAGIFKPAIPALTVPQPEEAMESLQQRAEEAGTPLSVVDPSWKVLDGIRLGLPGLHQRLNAALAVALCHVWLQRTGREAEAAAFNAAQQQGELPAAFKKGLERAFWPGRGQVVHDEVRRAAAAAGGGAAAAASAGMEGLAAEAAAGAAAEAAAGGLVEGEEAKAVKGVARGLSFFLDGAHTPESMEVCGAWFCDEVKGEEREGEERDGEEREAVPLMTCSRDVKRILLFNCMPERDPSLLLPQLLSTIDAKGIHFHRALFVPNLSSYNVVGPHKSPASSPASSPPRSATPPSKPSPVTPSTLASSMSVEGVDLAWQRRIQAVWEGLLDLRQKSGDANPRGGPKLGPSNMDDSIPMVPISPSFIHQSPLPFTSRNHDGELNDRVPTTNAFVASTSAVLPSLPAAIGLLRRCAMDHPQLRLQVLVTGSLHLVGDVLRLLKK